MSTLTGNVLSGSTNGLPIKIGATGTPGTTIHTAGSGTTGFDEIYIWVTNSDSVPRNLTIEWGGTTSPDNLIVNTLSIPALSGPIIVVPGIRLNNAKVVSAFASVANVLILTGFFNRVS